LAFAPAILVAIMTATFDVEPDLGEHLEKLCRITNLGAGEIISLILEPPLRQIIEDHDTGLLQDFIHPLVFDTKEEALAVIDGYERFISESDNCCYDHDAKPARTRDGQWRILFRSTHPDEEGAIYQ